jgi:hypothetical protein
VLSALKGRGGGAGRREGVGAERPARPWERGGDGWGLKTILTGVSRPSVRVREGGVGGPGWRIGPRYFVAGANGWAARGKENKKKKKVGCGLDGGM